MVVDGGGGWWVCKPILVFSLSLGQAEQKEIFCGRKEVKDRLKKCILDNFWSPTSFINYIYYISFGSAWPKLALFDPVWVLWLPSGSICICLALFGTDCSRLAPIGPIWSVWPVGPNWRHLALFGPV